MGEREFPFDLRLVVLPIAAGAAAVVLNQARGPFWANADPSYAYLFNSLLIVSGNAPFHLDHPGTPLQIAGAAVVYLLTPFAGADARLAAVFQDPERFLRILYHTVLVSHCLALAVLGHVASRVLRSVRAALIAQSTPLLSYYFLWALSAYQPEPVLLILTTALSIAVLLWLRRAESQGDRDGFAIVMGMIVAVAVATKITALPLLVIPLVLYGLSPALFRFLLAFVVTFLIAIAPMLSEAGRALSWYAQILTHTGRYGEGSAGVLEVGRYAFALRALVRLDLVCFALVIGTVILTLLGRPPIDERLKALSPRMRVILAILAVQGLQLLLVAKHPDNHYLIPATGLVALAFALAWTEAERRLGTRGAINNSALLLLAGAVAVVRMSGPGHLAPWGDYAYAVREARRAREGVRALNSDRTVPEGRAVLVQFYGSSSPAFALKFGDMTSGGIFGPRLCGIWGPQGVFYNLWTREYGTLCGPLTAAAVAHRADAGAEIWFRGMSLAGEFADLRPAEFDLKPLRAVSSPVGEVVYGAFARATPATRP